jgi:alkylated DNA repair dioxygenase AlkB
MTIISDCHCERSEAIPMASRAGLNEHQPMATVQLCLFHVMSPVAAVLPEGFVYRAAVVPEAEEGELLARFAELPLKEFEFHGYFGKRRVVSFGLRYDFADREVHRVEPIPDFLLPLRERAAAFAGVASSAVEHALVTEYRPGAAIGWHRDRPVFGDVIGISFGSDCRFRFRRRHGNSWERRAIMLEPRSAYVLRGAAREKWEHSIPPAEALRYSVTFRTMPAR